MSDNFWRNQIPWLPSAQGGATGGGGGTGSLTDTFGVQWRGNLDYARSGALGRGRIGEADYPDGYLGDTNSRYADKLNNAISGRLSDRSYQRGIHRGVKMDPQQYFWPAECRPDAGLRRAARAVPDGNTMLVERNHPAGVPIEYLAHGGKLSSVGNAEKEKIARAYGVNPADHKPEELVSPERQAQLAKYMPTWSW